MRTKDGPGGNTKGRKQDSRGSPDQDQQESARQTGSHGNRSGPKGASPDKHGGSGTGRQQGGSGAGRER
jgi:hypothetical protein